MGGSLGPPPLHFLSIRDGPSVACILGCTWLMYSLCMAHLWSIYDLYMVNMTYMSSYPAGGFEHAQFLLSKRSAIRSHSIFTIKVHQKDDEDKSKNVFAKLNLVVPAYSHYQ